MGSETGLAGVTALDHTADVGIDLEAPTLEDLFLRAAAGMMWLLRGEDGSPELRRADLGGAYRQDSEGSAESRPLAVTAADPAALLREWLRELLFWYEVEGLAFEGARFEALSDTGLVAEVEVVADRVEPIREIKGVTLHGLLAEHRGDGWVGRVIFDV
jgi:SHS2 domain-containing protein